MIKEPNACEANCAFCSSVNCPSAVAAKALAPLLISFYTSAKALA
jgi:hypothetical protein